MSDDNEKVQFFKVEPVLKAQTDDELRASGMSEDDIARLHHSVYITMALWRPHAEKMARMIREFKLEDED